MDKVQMRVGKILCVFSFAIFIIRVIPSFFIPVLVYNNISLLFFLYNIRIIFYSILFLFSFLYISNVFKIVQIVLILIESIISLNSHSNTCFFGLLLIVSAILLCYIYGFFNYRKKLKIVVVVCFLYILFVCLPLRNYFDKFLLALKWELFIITFIYCLWYLLKDILEEIKIKEFEERQEIIKTMEKSNEIAKDAIVLCENYFNKYYKKEKL